MFYSINSVIVKEGTIFAYTIKSTGSNDTCGQKKNSKFIKTEIYENQSIRLGLYPWRQDQAIFRKRNYRQQISTYRSRLYSSILGNGRSGKDYRCKCAIEIRKCRMFITIEL